MIPEIQEAIRRQQLDGWLFFDHHQRDPLAYQILKLDQKAKPSRRWYYFVPAFGTSRKLVHRIEAQVLDELPGDKDLYSSWVEQQAKLHGLLKGAARIAMQYSPNCSIPYISNVDGGTLEVIRGCGVEVVSSADMVQEFQARWSDEQLTTHLEAGVKVDQIRRQAFELVGERLKGGVRVNEFDVQTFILQRFADSGLQTDHGPIVAVNQNASDPHYEPTSTRNTEIHKLDLLLIDLWAKLRVPNAVYYDVTWTGYCGPVVPDPIQKVFEIVKGARTSASNFVIERVAKRQELSGWEVDDAARQFIGSHNLAEFFFHRTGHSIGVEVHGNGANMDNFESHDDRKVISNTCFSIEPGIYLSEFGIRSEVNMYIELEKAYVTGQQQDSLIRILD